MYSYGHCDKPACRGKPTAWMSPEGSRPEFDMARIQDTIGVLDQGMFLKGWLGNLGDPNVSICRNGQEKAVREGKTPTSVEGVSA